MAMSSPLADHPADLDRDLIEAQVAIDAAMTLLKHGLVGADVLPLPLAATGAVGQLVRARRFLWALYRQLAA